MNSSFARLFSLAVVALSAGALSAYAEGSTLFWGADGLGTSGSWTATGVDWSDGSQAVAWTDGGAAVFQGAGGEVGTYVFGPTASSLTFATPGYAITTGWLNGGADGLMVNTAADATISATLRDDAPFDANGFTKTGAGTLTVAGVNFFGSVRVAEGEYVATSTSAAFFSDFRVETGAKLMLAPTSGNPISVGSISGDGVVRPDAQARTVTATFFGINDFTGNLQDNGSGVLAIDYFGASTTPGRLLSAAEYTGATTISAGTLSLASGGAIYDSSSVTISGSGKLLLDNKSVSSSGNRLGNAAPVKLQSGGTLEMTASYNGVNEIAGKLSAVGSGNVVLTATSDLHAPAIQFGGFQRSENGTLAISGSGNVTLAGVGNGSTGIVTPAITMNNEWVSADAAGKLTAFTGYLEKFDGGSPSDHVKLNADASVVTGGPPILTRASLNLVSNGGSHMLSLHVNLTLTSGGLLSSGTGPQIIMGSLLTAPSELVVTNTNPLVIYSAIVNSSQPLALTKSGAGTLYLNGYNSYSGLTTINQGTLAVANPAAFGNGSSIVFGGGTLQARGDFTLTKNLVGVGGSGARIETAGRFVTLTGALSGGLSKTGAGTLQLNQSQLGSVNVGEGTLVAPSAMSGSVALENGARIDAKGALDTLTLNGSGELGIGDANDTATLVLNTISLWQSTSKLTINFGLGSGAQDMLVLTSPFGLGPLNEGAFQFAFTDLGGLTTGVDYQVIAFGTGGSSLDASNFVLTPGLVSAGWAAQFQVTSEGVAVNFSAVPEPGSLALLALGLAGVGLTNLRRRIR